MLKSVSTALAAAALLGATSGIALAASSASVGGITVIVDPDYVAGSSTAPTPSSTTGSVMTFSAGTAGNNGGQGLNPFSTVLTAGDTFLSILGGSSATFSFSGGVSAFTFYLGSLDTWNTISYVLSNGSTGSITGSSLSSAFGGSLPMSSGGFLTQLSAGFESFKSITFSSSTNSFEIAFVSTTKRDNPVPGPIAGAGIPAILAGLGYLAYRRRQAA